MYHRLFAQCIEPSEHLKQWFSAIFWAPKSLGGGGRVCVWGVLPNDSNMQRKLRITAKQPLPLRETGLQSFLGPFHGLEFFSPSPWLAHI